MREVSGDYAVLTCNKRELTLIYESLSYAKVCPLIDDVTRSEIEQCMSVIRKYASLRGDTL